MSSQLSERIISCSMIERLGQQNNQPFNRCRMYSIRTKQMKVKTSRKGGAIIVVIAFYAIAITMMGVWIRSALTHQRQISRWQQRTQTVWLAESGVRRAAARIAEDAHYEGETWHISASELGGRNAAEVVIVVEQVKNEEGPEVKVDQSKTLVRITATATYPFDSQQKNRITKTIIINPPGTSDQSGATS